MNKLYSVDNFVLRGDVNPRANNGDIEMRKSEISKAAFGKRQEYRAVAELLNRGYDVYMPLVDDKQIDCVLRIDDNRYLDIQIKARSKQAKFNMGGVFTAKDFEPRDTYFFIFYSEEIDTYWIMPSRKLKEYTSIAKNGFFAIRLAGKVRGKDEILPKAKYSEYENNFELLK